MDILLKHKWDDSYHRGENSIFFPKEEVVKFLNRFVRKRVGIDKFYDIIDFNEKITGLDYGCGIGSTTLLMEEFGIEAYGSDISSNAIEVAKQMAINNGNPKLKERFSVTDGLIIPFDDIFFDIVICDSVLDSMHFKIAQKVIKELERVTKRLAYISLISGDDGIHFREFCDEEINQAQHEQGTCQSFYNWSKMQQLISQTNFKTIWCHLLSEESLLERYKCARYHLILSK
ncbi:MAG: class I SAM-dependent methyltransferase [Vulcanimicrobiota bacterium]